MSDLRRRLIERAEHNDEIEESTTAELLREAEAALAKAERDRDEARAALMAWHHQQGEISRIENERTCQPAATAAIVLRDFSKDGYQAFAFEDARDAVNFLRGRLPGGGVFMQERNQRLFSILEWHWHPAATTGQS